MYTEVRRLMARKKSVPQKEKSRTWARMNMINTSSKPRLKGIDKNRLFKDKGKDQNFTARISQNGEQRLTKREWSIINMSMIIRITEKWPLEMKEK